MKTPSVALKKRNQEIKTFSVALQRGVKIVKQREESLVYYRYDWYEQVAHSLVWTINQ